MNLSVTPILPISERKREEGTSFRPEKAIDSKVRGIVLERISQARGGLLPSASAPEIIIGLLPGFDSGKLGRSQPEKRKIKHRKTPWIRKTPIGLFRVDPEGWLNALMQFVLYAPGFAEGFSFAPRSFYPVQEFIDRYVQDQQENRTISSADGVSVFRFFSQKLPGFSLIEIVKYLMSLIHPKWDVKKSLTEALMSGQGDLFVSEGPIKKQVFAEPELYYDLDAFIEKRPDGASVNYIAYVKVDGGWYQCDDERITQLRSDSLAIPLQRAVLSHYKRIFLGKIGLYCK